jgi:hypothetical protein
VAGNKEVPRVQNPPSGDGHHISHRFMTATELAERETRQNAYEAMLARQDAFERSREIVAKTHEPVRAGCVFAKSCNLPDAIIDYSNPSGMVPTDSLKDYGEIAWLGAREADDAGLLSLETISGSTLSLGIGRLALSAPALSAPVAAIGAAGTAALATVVALFWTPSLGDSALYNEDQLRALKQARTRVRLQVEQQADGSLKGYGFYTGKNRDWEMVDVVQFTLRGSQQVADLGDGVELIWTPAVDASDMLGIPALEAAPQAPHVWVYPPTKQADSIIVDPVYPPEYKDFILVFPANSGIRSLYVVVAKPFNGSYHTPPKTLPAFPDAIPVRTKGNRKRWESKKRIYEWDYQHGAVEVYNWAGDHLGEFNAETGEQTDDAKPERRTYTK